MYGIKQTGVYHKKTSVLRSCVGLPGGIEEEGDPCSLVVAVEKKMVT